jgi:hypothetical protein
MKKLPVDIAAIEEWVEAHDGRLDHAAQSLGLKRPAALHIWRWRGIPANKRYDFWVRLNAVRKKADRPLIPLHWLSEEAAREGAPATKALVTKAWRGGGPSKETKKKGATGKRRPWSPKKLGSRSKLVEASS